MFVSAAPAPRIHAAAPPIVSLPQDESRQGLTYFHETIYSGLPVFLRRIDTALKNIGQPGLPLDAKLFSFGAHDAGAPEVHDLVLSKLGASTSRSVVLA